MWEKPDRDVLVDERLQAKYLGEIQGHVCDAAGLIAGMLEGMRAAGFHCVASADITPTEFEVYCRGRYALNLLSWVSETITGDPLPDARRLGVRRARPDGMQMYCVIPGAWSADAMAMLVAESEACQFGMVRAFDQIEAYFRKVVHLGYNPTAYALAQSCPSAMVAMADLWESMRSLDWLAARWN